jgi:hypothetical protein
VSALTFDTVSVRVTGSIRAQHSGALANALVYSSLQDQTVPLPLDSAAWETKLNQLIAESKLEKKVMQVEAGDFASSFRR